MVTGPRPKEKAETNTEIPRMERRGVSVFKTDSKDEGGSSGPVTRVAQQLPRAHSLESSASTIIRRESYSP